MFVEEGREPFVLSYEFCAKTTVDETKISDASKDKIAERIEGLARIQIGEEINHNYFKDSTTKSIVDCSLCTEIIEGHHDLATVENEYISNVSLGGDTEKVSSGAALSDLVVAEIKDGDTNSEDSDKLKPDHDHFLINIIDFENKKVLVRAHQRESTKGKNVIVSDEYIAKMIKSRSPEVNVWKVNQRGSMHSAFKPAFEFLLSRYATRQKRGVFQRARGFQISGPPEIKHNTSHGQFRARSNLSYKPNYVRLSEGIGATQWCGFSDHQYEGPGRQWQNIPWSRHRRGAEDRASDVTVLCNGDADPIQKIGGADWVSRPCKEELRILVGTVPCRIQSEVVRRRE
jgi:hypothetical protein